MRDFPRTVRFGRLNRAINHRRGNIIVLSALLMVLMMFVLAMSIDVGYIYTMQAQLDRAVDAAALAGVQDLVNGTDAAQAKAAEYLCRNPVGSSMTFIDETQLAGQLTTFKSQHSSDYQMKAGSWNTTTRSFSETSVTPSALQVTMTYPNMPFFFGRALGKDTFTVTSSATAMFQPRDIMVVLDYSASMNDDSTFARIGLLGRSAVETSLQNCWNDLGPPSYGNLQFTPQWAVASGQAANVGSKIPHITVEYRNTAVYVTCTHALTSVKLTFSGGATQTISSSASSGTFQGSGSNSGDTITKVKVTSWSNNGETFDFTSNTTFINALGLNNVTYPYAGGSWSDYIDYATGGSSTNASAGYEYKFGGMNLVEYWLDWHPSYAAWADGWKVRAEPQYALKDAMGVFMDFIGSVDTNDRVGLVVYDSTSGNATLESALTNTYSTISNIVSHRQAGHYHDYTNIGAGMKLARQQLESTARANSCKLIVLITDGLANFYNGSYNLSAAHQQILDEANSSLADKYKIMTLSVGIMADTATMQTVADTTKGVAYVVPGGSDHQSMHDNLKKAFQDIANARPMLLVQ
ncbi:MAG TPA: TadE/TadG family type IV pilus assembly protein [Pirellulaceae bacterium]|jgi:Flp pilus assembly protein TadG